MPRDDFSKPFSGIAQELAMPSNPTDFTRKMQEWLILLNYMRGRIDGVFGPKTLASLRAYVERQVENWIRSKDLLAPFAPLREQGAWVPSARLVLEEHFPAEHRGVWADSIADVSEGAAWLDRNRAYIWELLTARLRQLSRLSDPANMKTKPESYNDRIVQIAKCWNSIGVKEISPNDGPWVRSIMLGKGGKIWQWCAGFVSIVMAQAAHSMELPDIDKGPTFGLPIVPSFGVPNLVQSAKRRGRFYEDVRGIEAGDLFVIPTVSGSWSHVGFVHHVSLVNGKLYLNTIEGNTNENGSRDGTVVRSIERDHRKLDFIKLG